MRMRDLPVKAAREISLHRGLERSNVFVLGDQVGTVLIGVPLRRDPDGNIAFEAAGVVG